MEPDDYQEQQDSLNINDRTWQDGSSGSMGGGLPSNKKEGTNLGSMGGPKKEKKPAFSVVDYEKQLEKWSSPEFKAGYQALLDEIEKEAQVSEKEQPENKVGSGNLIDVIRKQVEEDADLEKEEGTDEEDLPTAKELSERFGGSFAPILERFKEQIRFEIEDGTRALEVPYKLRVLGDQLKFLIQNASDYVNLTLEDTETDLVKKISLELCRIDIRIKDFEYDDYDNPEGVFEESYDLVKSCRGIDEDGIVINAGFGNEWVEMKLRDEKNDRILIVGFKAYLQVPKK